MLCRILTKELFYKSPFNFLKCLYNVAASVTSIQNLPAGKYEIFVCSFLILCYNSPGLSQLTMCSKGFSLFFSLSS